MPHARVLLVGALYLAATASVFVLHAQVRGGAVVKESAPASTTERPVERGISEALAAERGAVIRDLRYQLRFVIPSDRQEPVRGTATARLTLNAPHRLVFDFAQPADRLSRTSVNGRGLQPQFVNGHIIVPAEATRSGANEIAFDFTAGEDALNRNDEFLYTLFVPARAQLTFPSFDQPDLKARYSLALEVPEGWQAIANGEEQRRQGVAGDREQRRQGVAGDREQRRQGVAGDRERLRDGRVVEFAETAPLPTYLFSFAAGKFSLETATRNGRTLRMFHRETDAAKVARNRDAVFDLHARALAWLENYTAIPYAFGKFDVVLIPSFQFSGMEHAGAILYNQSALMLEESATQNQLLDRASVIAHETAHMWFGDLVTMKWFNDVWMKEVFANFMAAKIVNPSFPQVNHDLRFLLAHYPSAYQVDRTAGTNAIRQRLSNLNDAGQMYGPIIYQKAPIVMRQLEMMVGEGPFRQAMREYLKRYAFGNATWLDLVRILDARTPQDIASWSRAWVEERGRPEFVTSVRMNTEGTPPRRSGRPGRIAGISLTAKDPVNRGLVWPQRLQVTLGYANGPRTVTVDASRPVVSLPGVAGLEPPLYVLPNGGGVGYGLFILDDTSRRYFLEHIEQVPAALTRGSAWVTLWDNLLEGHIEPARLLDTALRALPLEGDEQNAQRVLAYVTRTFWRWLPSSERQSRGPAVERTLREGLDRAKTQSQKAAWFNAYRDIVMSKDGLAWLERVWRREEQVPGLTLAEPDEIALALELAVREVPGWSRILDAQHERTQNPDRKARFAFVMPALSADAAMREQAFERFRRLENRRREPWVLESMAYLNHPLREEHGKRFVRPALELLREIQRTGDIFFPTRWMDATLAGHRSPEVAATIRDFLARDPLYPQRLRWTILSSADELFRVAK